MRICYIQPPALSAFLLIFIVSAGCFAQYEESLGGDNELPFLSTRNAIIVDDTDEELILKGANFGGWLLWEGNTLSLPNHPQYEIRNAMEKAAGREKAGLFFETFEDNFIRPGDFANVKAAGLNVVRLPFHYRCIEDEDGAKLNEAIEWAKLYGVYVILDMHAAPGCQNIDYHSDSSGVARLWDDNGYQKEYVRLWRVLAERYRDEPTVAGYEILNEPSVDDDDKLVELYERAIAAIREIDDKHIIFLDGNNYAYDLGLFDGRDFGENVVYVFHTYEEPRGVKETLNRYESYDLDAPLMCGEYGQQFGNTFLFDEARISWAPWSYKAISHTPESPPFFYHPPSDNLWARWVGSINARYERDLTARADDMERIAAESELCGECKRFFLGLLREGLRENKEVIGDLGRRHPADKEKITEIYLELAAYQDDLYMETLTGSIAAMERDGIMELTASLDTGSWVKAVGSEEYNELMERTR